MWICQAFVSLGKIVLLRSGQSSKVLFPHLFVGNLNGKMSQISELLPASEFYSHWDYHTFNNRFGVIFFVIENFIPFSKKNGWWHRNLLLVFLAKKTAVTSVRNFHTFPGAVLNVRWSGNKKALIWMITSWRTHQIVACLRKDDRVARAGDQCPE